MGWPSWGWGLLAGQRNILNHNHHDWYFAWFCFRKADWIPNYISLIFINIKTSNHSDKKSHFSSAALSASKNVRSLVAGCLICKLCFMSVFLILRCVFLRSGRTCSNKGVSQTPQLASCLFPALGNPEFLQRFVSWPWWVVCSSLRAL